MSNYYFMKLLKTESVKNVSACHTVFAYCKGSNNNNSMKT